ncbi:hypothetical protein DN069_30710 [Streptacidiphilus pinicola]|uniref:Uncharacterized protein n=1 Tax=Streptacidiphilus pinicola TaxID=2219663 RepID=A0A2X0IA32_9ACTN|nr:hypothetical protein [Streptacidiphilus pinicola]RAG81832.1 hypothetical protein DN069_30710 [Streptacidiphilus pinicola]
MSVNSIHRVRAAAITGLAAVAIGGTALTGTAYAKSGAYVQVSAHAVRIGQNIQVTASGGDDSVRYTFACLDERIGNGGWFALGCSGRPWSAYGRSVRATSFGRVQFRARLIAKSRPTGNGWLDRVSGSVDVLVR